MQWNEGLKALNWKDGNLLSVRLDLVQVAETVQLVSVLLDADEDERRPFFKEMGHLTRVCSTCSL
jgi:hypothetical protein